MIITQKSLRIWSTVKVSMVRRCPRNACTCYFYLSTKQIIGFRFAARLGNGSLLVSTGPNFVSVVNLNITKTRPCNMQQYFTAVKMFIFR